jgi:glycosyltransferase involved in cell wall biosynthesis
MRSNHEPIRVLYSFPHRLGKERICHTAWQQVNGLAAAGAELTVFAGSIERQVPDGVLVNPTLTFGSWRLPYRAIGQRRALVLHDLIVARRLAKMAGSVDIVHTWPQGAARTLEVAGSLGIPTVLERPNAHTRYAYEVVRDECGKLGMSLPPDHEHAYNEQILAREEAEFRLAYRLLCPSDFVAKTFKDRGFDDAQLARHQYGYDPTVYFPDREAKNPAPGLRMLFAGGCAPRKGLHYALAAWLRSAACRDGEFLVAGEFVPGYRECLSHTLDHPSIKVLGHRTDLPLLMRSSDILVLPSIEEGSALVTSEARGSGCVLLVSQAAGAVCTHMKDSMVHVVGDVGTLAQHIDMLHTNRELLCSLRRASLDTASEISWHAAGRTLLDVYKQTIAQHADQQASSFTEAAIRRSTMQAGGDGLGAPYQEHAAPRAANTPW